MISTRRVVVSSRSRCSQPCAGSRRRTVPYSLKPRRLFSSPAVRRCRRRPSSSPKILKALHQEYHGYGNAAAQAVSVAEAWPGQRVVVSGLCRQRAGVHPVQHMTTDNVLYLCHGVDADAWKTVVSIIPKDDLS